MRVLPTANPEPLIVWTKCLASFVLYLIFDLLAWKSEKLEQDEISLYLFWLGIHTSISKVFDEEKPRSPVHNSTIWYGSSNLLRISHALLSKFSKQRNFNV